MAASLGAASLAIRWPGVAMYDTISQYEQASDGVFADWHPPIMARLWSLILPLWPGTAPMLVLQMLLWWGGLGLLAGALARTGRGRAAAIVLAIGACPLWLGWATVVLKDVGMAACLVAAAGLVAHWRLEGRPLPRWTTALIVLLLGYATLVRGNGLFATIPFGLALAGWFGLRKRRTRAGLLLASLLAVLALSPLINRELLGAEASHVERALPLYDIAGIAHFARLATVPGLPSAEWAEAERKGCYKPYFWNPYGMPSQCEHVGRVVAFDPGEGDHIMRVWTRMVATHPIAWGMHRAAHLNENLRVLVGRGEYDAIPPIDSEPNELGLGAPPGKAAHVLIKVATWLTETPIGWPYMWLAVALLTLGAMAREQATPQIRLARALALSAAAMSASFALVSIASDLRYHLWSMLAAALAATLAIDAGAMRRRWKGGAALLAVLALAGAAARIAHPYGPSPYPPDPPPPTAASH